MFRTFFPLHFLLGFLMSCRLQSGISRLYGGDCFRMSLLSFLIFFFFDLEVIRIMVDLIDFYPRLPFGIVVGVEVPPPYAR